MKGGLNLRDDTLFDKLDVSPKTDVSKLIKMQKEVNTNNIKSIINNSLEVIEENFYKLGFIDSNTDKSSADKSSIDISNDKLCKILNKLNDNLTSNADNFIAYTANLYKIFYGLFKEEKLILDSTEKFEDNKIHDCIKKTLEKRILQNLKYFKIYVNHYQQGKFLKIIYKIEKKLLKGDDLVTIYEKIENFKYIFELDVYYSIIYNQSLLEKTNGNKSLTGGSGPAATDPETATDPAATDPETATDPAATPTAAAAPSTTTDFIYIPAISIAIKENNLEHAKILISRIKALDKIYNEIRSIIMDPTFKTLLKLHLTKKKTNNDAFYANLELKDNSYFIDIDTLKNTVCENLSEVHPQPPQSPQSPQPRDPPLNSKNNDDTLSNKRDIRKILQDIFDVDVDDNDDYFEMFKQYKSKLKTSLKGGTVAIEKPVSDVERKVLLIGKYPTKILKVDEDDKTILKGGSGDDNIQNPVSSIANKTLDVDTSDNIKTQQTNFIDSLKKKLENVNPDSEPVESISDSTKRYANKLFSDVKNVMSKKNPIENEAKVLDDDYEEILKQFDPKKIHNMTYEELRKVIYKIKNSEYFENIQIENEDVYTFIAVTYILRIISLYITTWFIEIEILKDIESVISSYIIIYILLFLLIYTFVNLSDNKLHTTKGYLYYFYSRVNFDYTRFIIHLGILLLLIIIPFMIRVTDKDSVTYKQTSDQKKHYLNKLISNMSAIIWVILSIIAFFFK